MLGKAGEKVVRGVKIACQIASKICWQDDSAYHIGDMVEKICGHAYKEDKSHQNKERDYHREPKEQRLS